MPRDSSGNYSLPPAYNPVLTGTTITSAWANTTMSDIAAALTDSLSRSGHGGLTSSLLLPDGTSGAPGLAFASELSTGLYRNGASQPTFVVGGVPVWSSNSSHQLLIQPPTGTVFSAPSSGYSITINSALAITIAGPAATQLSALNFLQSGQQGWVIYQPASSDDFRIYNGTSTDVLILHKTGAVAIPTPQSGVTALTVNGVAGNSAVTIISPNTAGQSFGLSMNAGTNTSDYCMSLFNAAASNIYYLQGDGQAFILTPPGGTDRSGSSQYQIGYIDAPIHAISASTPLSATDRGKTIQLTGGTGQTVTLPTSSGPGGAMILIVNLSGSSWGIAASALTWLPNNTSGSRSLANAGVVTCWSSGGSTWYIWGLGIS